MPAHSASAPVRGAAASASRRRRPAECEPLRPAAAATPAMDAPTEAAVERASRPLAPAARVHGASCSRRIPHPPGAGRARASNGRLQTSSEAPVLDVVPLVPAISVRAPAVPLIPAAVVPRSPPSPATSVHAPNSLRLPAISLRGPLMPPNWSSRASACACRTPLLPLQMMTLSAIVSGRLRAPAADSVRHSSQPVHAAVKF
jgi:hypothetical protein